MIVRFDDDPLEEIEEAIAYSREHFGLGIEFRMQIDSILKKIQATRFPYTLYYGFLPEKSEVTIYALAHHSREPNYWMSRRSTT